MQQHDNGPFSSRGDDPQTTGGQVRHCGYVPPGHRSRAYSIWNPVPAERHGRQTEAYFVRAAHIDWIEAAGNYLRLHVGDKVHLIRRTMDDMEQQLDPDNFARIHRSSIVNLNRVKEIQRGNGSEFEVVLKNGKRLRMSRGFRHGLDP